MDIEYFSQLSFRSFPNLLLFQFSDQQSFLKLEELDGLSTYDLSLNSNMKQPSHSNKTRTYSNQFLPPGISTVHACHVSRWIFQLLFLLNCKDIGWQSRIYFFNCFHWALIMRWTALSSPVLLYLSLHIYAASISPVYLPLCSQRTNHPSFSKVYPFLWALCYFVPVYTREEKRINKFMD